MTLSEKTEQLKIELGQSDGIEHTAYAEYLFNSLPCSSKQINTPFLNNAVNKRADAIYGVVKPGRVYQELCPLTSKA
jgi:hypothetical protein